MKVYENTGVLSTGNLRITKSISSLLIRTDRPLSEMGNEIISVWIEKSNGTNHNIAMQVPLLDFMLLGTYGTSAVYNQTGTSFVTCALVELTPEFAIKLQENESIIIKIDGLASAKTYSINGIEEPVTADATIYLDRKVCLVGQISTKYDVSNYESVSIINHENVNELVLKFDNGQTVRYLKEEFVALSIDTDPVLQVSSTGTVVSELTSRLVFPLHGVEEIEVWKTQSEQVDLILKDDTLIN